MRRVKPRRALCSSRRRLLVHELPSRCANDAMWMTVTFIGTASVFLAMTLVTLWHLRWVQRVPPLEKLPPTNVKIRCSVVIAARDEEARIEETIRQLLAQREVEL